MILFIRTVHAVITAFFLTCMAVLWYAAMSGELQLWGWTASGLVTLEGLVVTLNGGDCPLGRAHHRFGDDRAFFELLLPARAAKLAVPVLGLVASASLALLALRSLAR